jgi:hypothetical protein
MSGSLREFYRKALNPDEFTRSGFVEVRFIGPYPQAIIRFHKTNEKTSVGFSLDYSDIPTEMEDIIKWSEEGHEPDESGDLKQVMLISGTTIFGLGEFLRVDGSPVENPAFQLRFGRSKTLWRSQHDGSHDQKRRTEG